MHLLDLQTRIRKVLGDGGGVEIPAFMRPLPRMWMHPDFILRAFGEESLDAYCFQPMFEEKSDGGPTPGMVPALVRMKLPFSHEWLEKIPAFLASALASFKPVPDGESTNPGKLPVSYFEAWGILEKPGLFMESGPSWTFSWKGFPIGQIRLFSSLFEEHLKTSAAVAVFDFQALFLLASRDSSEPAGASFAAPFQWGNGLALKDLFAFHPSFYPDVRTPYGSGGLKLDEIMKTLEGNLSERQWLDVYAGLLELAGFYYHPLSSGPECLATRTTLENRLKPIVKKFPAIIPGRVLASPRRTREGTNK